MTARGDRVELRYGAEVWIRPIRSADKRLLAAAFDHLSEQSRYRRFLHPIKGLRSRDLTYFTELDHHDHEALIALDDTGDVVGIARYIRSDAESAEAEVAIAVIDEWQGRGLGTQLLIRLMTRARSEGVRRFTGTALSENREVVELVEHLAPLVASRSSAGVTELEVSLPDQPHLLIAE
jgi:GNAT superfamily N-acetyltransferase